MRTHRDCGFTLLEVCIAIALLITAILGGWSLVAKANAHQQFLWDEWIAHELAASALETTTAEKELPLTPPQGRVFDFTTAQKYPLPPETKIVLYVESVPDSKVMLELRAVVTWRTAFGMAAGQRGEAEHSIRVRRPK